MKHSKTNLLAILSIIIFVVLSSVFAYYFWYDRAGPSYPNGTKLVNITATGEKYHKSSCSYLHSSSYEITLENAYAKGYDSCSVCDPPRLITEERYQKLKAEQSILLSILVVVFSSGLLTLGIYLAVLKIADALDLFTEFPDWFFIILAIAIFISICIQGIRVYIIW